MDQIYGSRESRDYLKEKKIRPSVKPFGRCKQDEVTNAEERWRKRKQRERNRIEGAIGNSKNYHELGLVRAKNAQTEKSCIQVALLSRNLMLAGKRA